MAAIGSSAVGQTLKPLGNSGKGGNNTGNGKPKPATKISSIFGN